MTFTDADNDVDLTNPASVTKAVAGDQPEISPPEDPIVELPRGIFHEGAWQTKVELHELTGADEERFTRYKDDELFLSILTSGISRIGTIDVDEKPMPEQEAIANSLLIGEQMLLLINIVRVTFGNERDFTWTCRSCTSDNTTVLLMSEDFPLKVPDGISEGHAFTDSAGNKITYVPVSGVHLSVLKPGMSQGAINSALLEQVIIEVNDKPPFNLPEFIKQMGMKDRRDLLAEIGKIQPEVDMNLSIKCAVCGEEQTSALSWGDLFRF